MSVWEMQLTRENTDFKNRNLLCITSAFLSSVLVREASGQPSLFYKFVECERVSLLTRADALALSHFSMYLISS